MKFPPYYNSTPALESILKELEILREAFKLVGILPQQAVYLRRQSLLKSSLFSARIEGNPIRPEDLSSSFQNPQSRHKKEIANILKAFSFLESQNGKNIDTEFLLSLHRTVMQDLSSETGRFRTEVSAIFNQAGVAIYLTPPPIMIENLINDLCLWNNKVFDPSPIKAAITHIWFEKIHPFLDGNGRVGRLLSSFIIRQGEYDFGGIVPFEQYLDENRESYYDALNSDNQDVTGFVEFFLTAFHTQARKSLEEAKNPPPEEKTNLLPRRAEIVDIIRDHNMVSFDFIARRFVVVPKSTLHFDVQQLLKQGYIKKLGTTRGVVYTIHQPPTTNYQPMFTIPRFK